MVRRCRRRGGLKWVDVGREKYRRGRCGQIINHQSNQIGHSRGNYIERNRALQNLRGRSMKENSVVALPFTAVPFLLFTFKLVMLLGGDYLMDQSCLDSLTRIVAVFETSPSFYFLAALCTAYSTISVAFLAVCYPPRLL